MGWDGLCSCLVEFIACQIINEVLYVQNGTVLATMSLTMHTARQQASKLLNENVFCISYSERSNHLCASCIELEHTLSIPLFSSLFVFYNFISSLLIIT